MTNPFPTRPGLDEFTPRPGCFVDAPREASKRVGSHERRDAHRPTRASEEGYVLLIAIFLMALLVISLAIAAPQIAKSIQRDRDLETFHRGMQYRRAIQVYYHNFRAYPPNVDALVETNNIRFLRKKYIDPITGKDDWKPVLFGQNKTPTAMGFFGQPLAGGATSIAGIGPGGGNGLNPNSPGGAVMPGGLGFLTGNPTSNTNSPSDTSNGAGSSTGSTGGTGTGAAGGTGSSTAFGQSGQSTGQNGQTFGGAGIIGFSPASPKKSILIYKKKDHYNEWEFTYDPISEMKTISGGNNGLNNSQAGTNSQNSTNSSAFGSSGSSFGNSGSSFGNNGSSFGNSNGSFGSSSFGNSTSNTTPTSPPQQ